MKYFVEKSGEENFKGENSKRILIFVFLGCMCSSKVFIFVVGGRFCSFG